MTNHPARSAIAKLARSYVASLNGVERVRINRDGEIHAYGTMPNTQQRGWYLAGYVDDIVRAPTHQHMLAVGIAPVPHRLSGFAEACYDQNSVAELLDAYLRRRADAVDCSEWRITPTEWRAAIREALEQRAYESRNA